MSKLLKFIVNSDLKIIVGLLLGVLTGLWDNPVLNQAVSVVSEIFLNLLKLVSTPLIFLSIVSTVSGMKDSGAFKNIGKRLIKYTLLTTYIAALVALLLYLIVDPSDSLAAKNWTQLPAEFEKGYLSHLVELFPSNIITPFSEHQVIGVLFLAVVFSLASLALPNEQRTVLHELFSSLYALIIKVTSWIIYLIPLAIWSFIALLVKEMQGGESYKPLVWYLLTIVGANLIQGLIILPLMAKMKGVSPIELAKNMMPALLLAFFSKSSSATLPLTMRCAVERAKLPKKLTDLAFPLCTAINMNGCAAFILITVLFVSMSHGMHYSWLEMGVWTVIATIAAVGNAGVPMGCYFLATAFLAAMNVPLNFLAVIFPFYAIIDMLETMLNVWSDSCVVAVVEKETRQVFEEENTAVAASPIP